MRTQVGAVVPGGRGGGRLTMNSLRGEGHRQGSSRMEADENQKQGKVKKREDTEIYNYLFRNCHFDMMVKVFQIKIKHLRF